MFRTRPLAAIRLSCPRPAAFAATALAVLFADSAALAQMPVLPSERQFVPNFGRPNDSIASSDEPVLTDPTLAPGDGTLVRDALAPLPGQARPTPRRRRIEEDEPFAPLGIEAGSFIMKPAAGAAIGYDSNPLRDRKAQGSIYERVEGAFAAASDWSRHSLAARVEGSFTTYNALPNNDRPELEGAVEGRVDILKDTRLEMTLRGGLDTEDPGDPDTPRNTKEPIITNTYGVEAGVVHAINRVEVGLHGAVDRYEFGDVRSDGRVRDQRRDYTLSEIRFRTGYEISPLLKPFAEIASNIRDYDFPVDRGGQRQGSEGWRLVGGFIYEPSPKLKAEIAGGYGQQYPDERTLRTLSGPIFDGTVTWRMTPLTRIILDGEIDFGETTFLRSSGTHERSASIEVVHALRRYLDLRGEFGWEQEEIVGRDIRDDTWSVGFSADWKLNRSLVAQARIAHEWQKSNDPRDNYRATIFEVGLRLQR
jgi:hypothetical protein